MGGERAQSPTERHWLGGRWSAALSLWTYFHRLLHLLGILSIDREELSLLLGHPIRIRHARSGRALEHSATLTRGRDDALSLSPRARDADIESLFFAHFGDDDELRLATARAPRAWVAVAPPRAGALTLAHSRAAAARFAVEQVGAHAVTLRAQPAGVAVRSAGALVRAGSAGARDGVELAHTEGIAAARARFELNVVPIRADALQRTDRRGGAGDSTLTAAAKAARSIPVRVQAEKSRAFLACVPGERVRATRAADSGWNTFRLELDARTGTAVLRDARRAALRFTRDFNGLCAGEAGERGERFVVEDVGGGCDDRVRLRSRKGYLSVLRNGEVRLERERSPGPREMFWLRLALPSMLEHSEPRRSLRKEPGGTRVVEASVEVPTDAETAYEVISDYEGFVNFVEDAAESGVLERTDERHLRVRMVQSHSFLVLTLNLAMIMDVEESPEEGKVCMEMVSGFGVKEYKGVWQAVPKGGDAESCVLSCVLRATPAFPAPAFLVDGIITHATCATLAQLRVECLRRKGASKNKSNGNGVTENSQ